MGAKLLSSKKTRANVQWHGSFVSLYAGLNINQQAMIKI